MKMVKWAYMWNSDEFISKKAYLQIIGICDASPIFLVDVEILCHGQVQILLLVAAKGSTQCQGLA
jgi:hypothetical protein